MNAAATMWSRYSAKNVTKRELSALKTALAIGHLLNRVVILPRFHCGLAHTECPLNSLIHIKTFDSVFSGQYRENSFLRHPKVPDSVKQGVTDLHINQTSSTLLSGADIVRLFSGESARVINLNDELLRVGIDMGDGSFDHRFSSKMRSAFRPCSYRQFCWSSTF